MELSKTKTWYIHRDRRRLAPALPVSILPFDRPPQRPVSGQPILAAASSAADAENGCEIMTTKKAGTSRTFYKAPDVSQMVSFLVCDNFATASQCCTFTS
jgi:hypothetical protein